VQPHGQQRTGPSAHADPIAHAPRRFAAKTWVYPAGVSERAYQLSIIRTALLNNTLVCLPTGLGKTLIAAVVMHNFSRWFPEARPWRGRSRSPLTASCWG
jgi:MoxR-like ATPase